MLIEIAIGDAFGMPYEFSGNKTSSITTYKKRFKQKFPYGKYGDDTQMSLAITEFLLNNKISYNSTTKTKIVEYFHSCFTRDKRTGYASGFYNLLNTTLNGKELQKNIIPQSERSGAAMRAVPIGYLSDLNEVIFFSAFQASTTHNTNLGIKTSIAVSLAAHYFIYKIGIKKYFRKYINDIINHNFITPWNGNIVSSSGIDCVIAAFTAIENNDNLKDILKESINYTGDVDTVASIALGIASCSNEIEKNLPLELYTQLENGTYGRDYLINLDQKLKAKFS